MLEKIYIELDWGKIEDRDGLTDEELKEAVNRYYGCVVRAAARRYGVSEQAAEEMLEGTPLKQLLQEHGFLQMRADPEGDLIELEQGGWIDIYR
ncbi:MAG: hypothetical protein IJI41_13790 [Anaerolineaceae bacterium]|nr:hypothetical protein [Anaerolineaceae bacterium]